MWIEKEASRVKTRVALQAASPRPRALPWGTGQGLWLTGSTSGPGPLLLEGLLGSPRARSWSCRELQCCVPPTEPLSPPHAALFLPDLFPNLLKDLLNPQVLVFSAW